MDDLGNLDGVDPERPNIARVYDYYLGGSHNFAADRRAADEAAKAFPATPAAARANRSFLRRAVRYLVGEGIDQFLDLGSGIPTVGNVHEIAQAANPASRVVYVDVEPVAVAHSLALLADNDRATALRADVRDVSGVLDSPEVRDLLDFSRPVGVLMVAMLHWIPDSADPHAVVAEYLRPCRSGSYLVMSHGCSDELAEESTAAIADVQRVVQESPFTIRSRERIAAFFEGLDLVEPGLVQLHDWRPDADKLEQLDTRYSILAGVSRVP